MYSIATVNRVAYKYQAHDIYNSIVRNKNSGQTVYSFHIVDPAILL